MKKKYPSHLGWIYDPVFWRSHSQMMQSSSIIIPHVHDIQLDSFSFPTEQIPQELIPFTQNGILDDFAYNTKHHERMT